VAIKDHEPIRGARLIFRFSIYSRFGVGALVAVLVIWSASVDLRARDQSKDWIVLKDCRLISNPANDGDSFHVSAGDKEYLFRLYFVDAPETDEMTPRRLIEQAKYFSITVPQAIELGRASKDFTQEKLSRPFIVLTHMSDAMGQSRLERFYAFVENKEGDVGEQLVRNGLARNYGFKAVPPGLRNAQLEVEKLQQFEDDAKREGIGGWGVNAERLNVRPQKPGSFSVFVAEKNGRSRRLPRPNTFHRTPTSLPSPSTAAVGSVESQSSNVNKVIELGQIDINKATEKELKMIPGIGSVLSGRIIAARPFRSADDLKKVNGIGDKKYAKIRPFFH